MNKRLCFGFAVLEASYWCFYASFIGFASAYLLHKGISNTILSLFIASYLFCAFLGSFVWGTICDKYHTNKKVFIFGVLGTGLHMYLVFFFGHNIAFTAITYPLLGFISQPLSSNIDAWVLSSCRHDSRIYGKIRSVPSFMYAFTAAIFGYFIGNYGYEFMLVGGTFFLITALVTAYLLPNVSLDEAKSSKKVSKEDLVSLFSNKPYRNLILMLFFIGLVIAPINNLKIILLEHVGGSVSDIGIDSFIGPMTQVPLIALAGNINRIPLKSRYIAMSVLPLSMLLLTFFAGSPTMIFMGTFVYNIGYGILLPTMRDVTEKNVSSNLRNLGHNLTDAVFNSFSGMISLLYSGAVVDYFGVDAMLLICIGIILIPVVMSCLRR